MKLGPGPTADVPCPAGSPGARPIPARAGVGFKPRHFDSLMAGAGRPPVAWLEVHAENYMGAGGLPHHHLTRLRERYPLSIHGVGLSLGGPGPLDAGHLDRLSLLIDRYQPGLFSEHLAWSTHAGDYLNDLLPLPYTAATLAHVADHVDETQERLGRRLLMENPSTYVRHAESDMDEVEFLRALVARTGCGLLLDVNNVHVSAANHGWSAADYLDRFPVEAVGEIHLAGHAVMADEDGTPLLVDAHDRQVAEAVWDLYRRAVARCGPRPTLIEWDNEVPAWEVLLDEAERAERLMTDRRTNADGRA